MPLKCKIHDKNAKAVCHHCGTPLCDIVELNNSMLVRGQQPAQQLTITQVCGYEIQDKLFYAPDEKHMVKAYHCEKCIHQFHSDYVGSLENLLNQISYDFTLSRKGRSR